MVSGFTADGVAHLNENLSPFGLTSYAVPGGTEQLDNVKLEPGSSVGVSMVRGDMVIGAIGTVTWTDDEGGSWLLAIPSSSMEIPTIS